MRVQARRELVELRDALMALHKSLLDSERGAYEAVFGPVGSTQQLLNLVLNDPWFAWLRQLSSLLTDMDERLEDKEAPLTVAQARQLMDATRVLVRPAEGDGGDFAEQYREALQRDPEVVMAHAEVALLLVRVV